MGVSHGSEPKVAILYLDRAGLPRAYAIGPADCEGEVRARATAHLERRLARFRAEHAEALSPSDFTLHRETC